MATVYGYCRISTARQNIERQERNIKDYDNTAVILKEAYTGTDMERPIYQQLKNNKSVKSVKEVILEYLPHPLPLASVTAVYQLMTFS